MWPERSVDIFWRLEHSALLFIAQCKANMNPFEQRNSLQKKVLLSHRMVPEELYLRLMRVTPKQASIVTTRSAKSPTPEAVGPFVGLHDRPTVGVGVGVGASVSFPYIS